MPSLSRDDSALAKWLFSGTYEEYKTKKEIMTLPYALGPDYACLDQKMTKQVLRQIMKPDLVAMVAEFHRKFGITRDPQFKNGAKVCLRYNLINEEVSELDEALFTDSGELRPEIDKLEVADALGDIIYVVLGAAEAWGIDINRVFAEIHRSNMTKEGGGTRADGKILKGPNYSPPDLSFVLDEKENKHEPPAKEKLKIRLDDEETKALWETAKRAKAEVESWPAWKRGE